MTDDELYIKLLYACEQKGFVTDYTMDLLGEVIESIVPEEEQGS